ncbi:hypothetical protein [Kandleria vitulina]|uniref:hypothetical protein n=1 Tax=Kandleria vitulina TaxID=1630 RepID=UPI0019310267|nr:hypothetical protein [Kandleria vitulina]
MRELEKLKAGLDFCFDDWDIASLKEMPGSVGEEVLIAKTFSCDNGKNIFIGNHFSVAIILQYLMQEKSLSAIMSLIWTQSQSDIHSLQKQDDNISQMLNLFI